MNRVTPLLLLISINSFGEDCDQVINQNLMSESNVVDKSEAKKAIFYKLCNSTYEEASKSSDFDAGGSYGVISAEASKSESEFKKWQTNSCTEYKDEQWEKKFSESSTKAMSLEAIRAWSECKKNQEGLFCTIDKQSKSGLVIFSYFWKQPGGGAATIDSSNIYNGYVLSPDKRTELESKGTNFLYGSKKYQIIASDIKNPVAISLNVNYAGTRIYSCSESISLINTDVCPKVVEKGISGRWCYSEIEQQATLQTVSAGVIQMPPPRLPLPFVFDLDGGKIKKFLSPSRPERVQVDSGSYSQIVQNGKNYTLSTKIPFEVPFAIDKAMFPLIGIGGVLPAPPPQNNPQPIKTNLISKFEFFMPNDNTLVMKGFTLTSDWPNSPDAGKSYPLYSFTRCE